MKTLVFSCYSFDQPFLEKAALNKHDLTFTKEALGLANVELAAGYDAIALRSSDDASAPVLERLVDLGVRFIALRTVGYDNVDLEVAERLSIRVAHVPEYSPYAIAEHGVAMLLMLNRKLYEAQLLIQMQDFRLDSLVGFDLHGKTVGIIGVGNIGFAFAKIMNGFGCKLLAHDPEKHPKSTGIGLEYVSKKELLRKSDIISLNCPLNEHTRYLIDFEEFAMMKKGAILINTARGGVVNTRALIENLKTGHIGGACLDVYEREKGLFFSDHRNTIIQDEMYHILRSFKNVLMTGHQAFLTKEALQGMATTTIANLDAWEAGGTSENELFCSILEHEYST